MASRRFSSPLEIPYELAEAYRAFVVHMPGVKPLKIEIQVEEGNVLVIGGERKWEEEEGIKYPKMDRRIGERKWEEEEGIKYLKMERRIGELMLKFSLPENADTDDVSAVCKDGVLTVTVKKLLPPPEPKKPRTAEVETADDDLGGFSGLLEIILMWIFVYMFLKLYEHLF